MCNNLLKGRKTCGGIPIIALDFVDEAAIFDPEYRRTTWKEWFTDVTGRQIDFPVSMIEGRASPPLSWLHGVVGHKLDRGSSDLSLS